MSIKKWFYPIICNAIILEKRKQNIYSLKYLPNSNILGMASQSMKETAFLMLGQTLDCSLYLWTACKSKLRFLLLNLFSQYSRYCKLMLIYIVSNISLYSIMVWVQKIIMRNHLHFIQIWLVIRQQNL